MLRRFAPHVTVHATPVEVRLACPPVQLAMPAELWLHPDGRIARAPETGARRVPLFGVDANGETSQHERLVAFLRVAFMEMQRERWLKRRPRVTFAAPDQLRSALGDVTRDILERAAYDAGALAVDFADFEERRSAPR